MAEGTSYEIDIPVSGAQATAAAASLDGLAISLERAGAASKSAASAVAAGQVAYAQAEANANKAAVAAERLGVAALAQEGKLAAALEAGDTASIDKAEAKLANLVARQSEAEAKSVAAGAALAEQVSSLDGLMASAGAAAAEEESLASQLDAVTVAEEANASAASAAAEAQASLASSGSEAGGSLRSVSGALGKLGGPLGSAGQSITGVANAFGKLAAMGPVGIAIGIAVAFVAVVAAVGAAGFALLKFGIANADAARTSALLTQGIAGSVAGGLALDKTIADLGNKVPIAADELRNMAADLAKSGLKGDALSTALEAAAVKAAKLRFGPNFAKQMLSLDLQSAKLKENIGAMFGGLEIEGILTALSKVVALFGVNSATANAVKAVFESVFQPILDSAEAMLPKVISAFLQLEILALKALIGIKRAVKPLGPEFQLVTDVVAGFATQAAVALGVVIAVVAIAAYNVLQFLRVVHEVREGLNQAGAASVAFGQAVAGGVAYGIGFMMAKFTEAKAFLAAIDLGQIGRDMVAGLAAGINSGASAVVDSIRNVAAGAVTSAKNALKINSPSKVFAEIGMSTAEGMSDGVEASAGAVQGSLESMVEPPRAGANSGAGAPAAAGGGPNFAGATLTFILNGVAGAEDAEARIRKVVLDYFEGVSMQGGGGVPA